MAGGMVVASLNARVGLDATQYERGAQRLSRANRQMRREQDRLRRSQQALNREFQRFGSTARTVALRFTVIQTALFATSRSLVNMGDELGKLSDRLNISIGELQELQLAAESVNVPFNRAARAIQTLQVRFARLGLDTSSFRTELEALDPELLAQLDNIDDINEAYRVYTERLTQLGREGRTLEQTQLAQAGFGQGAAQAGIQVLGQQQTARETLLGAGALLSEDDKKVFADTAQSFTDLSSVLKNQGIAAMTVLAERIADFNKTLEGLLTGPVPNILSAIAFGLTGLGVGRLVVGGGRLARRGYDHIRNLATVGRLPLPSWAQAIIGGTAGAGLLYGYNAPDALQEEIADRQLAQQALIGITPDQVERLRRVAGVRRPTSLPSFRDDHFGRFQNPLAGADSAEVRALFEELYGPDVAAAIIAEVDLVETGTYEDLVRSYTSRLEREIARGIDSDQQRRQIAKYTTRLNAARTGVVSEIAENQRRIDAALRAPLERALEFYESIAPEIDPDADGTETSGVDRATEERRAALARLEHRGVLRGRDLGADLDLSGLPDAQDQYRAHLRALREFYRSRTVQVPVGGRDLGADLDLGGLNEAFRVADENRLRDLEHARRLHQDQLELMDDYTEKLRESRKLTTELTGAIESSEGAFRRVFVDSIVEGRFQLESFRSVLQQVLKDLIDALAVKPFIDLLSGYAQQGIAAIIGGGGGGGANPVYNPGPGGPSGYAAAAAAPRFSAATSTPGPTVYLTVNGVEDQAAFDKVSARVEERLIPVVSRTLAANANRAGPVRAIRGY